MSGTKQNPKAEDHPKFMGRLLDGTAVFEFSNAQTLAQYSTEQAERNGQPEDIPPPPEPPPDDGRHHDGADIGSEKDRDQTTAETDTEGMPRLWDALDLKPAEQPRWLAKGRLPRAAVSLLVGDEGIGKSLLWVWIVAAITTGAPRPQFGIPDRDPSPVIIACTEDEWSTTVRPRLEVADADLAMIQVICTEDDGSGAPSFPRDLFLIAEADPKPALVVVDAWLDTVPAALQVRDPQQARLALHPWKELATVTDAAIWLLCHTNRVATPNARDRYGITGELRKKARMTLFAQSDEDGNLVVGPEKMNTAAPIPASMFTIKTVQHFDPTDDHDGTVPLLAYLGDSTQTAREHITDAYTDEHNPDAGADAVAWLAVFLAAGPRWATDVYTAAEAAGFSKDKTKRSKIKLNVSATRENFSSPWFWTLPQHQREHSRPLYLAPRSLGVSGTPWKFSRERFYQPRSVREQWRDTGNTLAP